MKLTRQHLRRLIREAILQEARGPLHEINLGRIKKRLDKAKKAVAEADAEWEESGRGHDDDTHPHEKFEFLQDKWRRLERTLSDSIDDLEDVSGEARDDMDDNDDLDASTYEEEIKKLQTLHSEYSAYYAGGSTPEERVQAAKGGQEEEPAYSSTVEDHMRVLKGHAEGMKERPDSPAAVQVQRERAVEFVRYLDEMKAKDKDRWDAMMANDTIRSGYEAAKALSAEDQEQEEPQGEEETKAEFKAKVGDKGVTAGTKVLKNGARGDGTTALQRLLKIRLDQHNISVPRFTKYGADGKFGDGTEDAVKKLQKVYKIKDDGDVGKNTYKALYNNSHPEGVPEINEAVARWKVLSGL